MIIYVSMHIIYIYLFICLNIYIYICIYIYGTLFFHMYLSNKIVLFLFFAGGLYHIYFYIMYTYTYTRRHGVPPRGASWDQLFRVYLGFHLVCLGFSPNSVSTLTRSYGGVKAGA